MSDEMRVLAPSDQKRLRELEETVERGLETFVEVGRALMEIRDERLYRADYDTFEAYCRDRWDMSRPYAYQIMAASETTERVSANADIQPPKNEAQARPLTKLPEEEQAEAWEEAVETAPEKNGEKRVTAKHVESVVDGRGDPEHGDDTKRGRSAGSGEGSFVKTVRRGMEMDANIIEVGRELGMNQHTFSKARYILLLHDDPTLNEENRERVERAVEYMEKHRQVSHPSDMVSDLLERKFGPSQKRGRSPESSADRHTENFDRAVGRIVTTCQLANEISVPLLESERGGSLMGDLGEAIQSLKSLRSRVEEATQ